MKNSQGKTKHVMVLERITLSKFQEEYLFLSESPSKLPTASTLFLVGKVNDTTDNPAMLYDALIYYEMDANHEQAAKMQAEGNKPGPLKNTMLEMD